MMYISNSTELGYDPAFFLSVFPANRQYWELLYRLTQQRYMAGNSRKR